MDRKQPIQAFLKECLRIRQLVQEERRLTDAEYRLLKSSLETLLGDLRNNIKRGKKKG